MESSSAAPAPPSTSTSTRPDTAPTTPACDQCRSRKIRCDRQTPECFNCTKAGVSCGFSNRGKRVNQTRQLLDDFSGLGSRLDSIDQSIAKISRRLSSADQTSPSASFESEVDDLDRFYTRLELDSSEQYATDSQQGEILHVIHQKFDSREGEQEYGSTAARCLIESSRRALGDMLGACQVKPSGLVSTFLSKDASFRTELKELYDAFPFRESCREPDFGSDGKSVSSPPRSFIHTVIEGFLSHVNTTRPIFQESKLNLAIEHTDSGHVSESTEARSLCFSNIILLMLGLKSRLARRSHCEVNGMDDDLKMSFWKNSRRAFGHLENYLEPRLINVQALATLAMVAREYCENQVFERLCHMTCLVAKSMGLHQLPRNSKGAMTETDAERTELFWALYGMDKERVFMTGQPCDFYFFDTDMQLLECEPEGTLQHYALAQTHMMSLWEEIYISLYSSGARRKGSEHRLKQVTKLTGLFRNWVHKYKVLLTAPLVGDASTRECFQLELKYCFHVGQILFNRCGREEVNRQQRMNSAYSALNIIKDIHEGSANLGNVALLGRLFRSYPSVAFLDLHTKILEAPDNKLKADVELLITTAEALHPLVDSNFPQAYYSRLHIGMMWCIKIANTVKVFTEQSSTTSTPEPSAGPPKTTAPRAVRSQKTPYRSNNSSSASSSSKVTHTSSQDESPRPRKKPSPPRSTRPQDVPTQAPPRAQKSTASARINDNGQNIYGPQASALLGEEEPADPLSALAIVPPGGDFQDWRFPTLNSDIGSAFMNMPNVSGPGEVYYEAGTFDDFMPKGGSVTEPWDMDFTNEIMLDGI